MPNSLTEDQLQQNWKNDEQMSSLELIKNDLDNVDDVFALGFGGGPINHDNENQEDGNLQDEWLNTSSENHDVSLDNTEANVIKEMQNDKQMLMEQLQSNDVMDQVVRKSIFTCYSLQINCWTSKSTTQNPF